jgi:hypothetical protein
MSEMPYYYNEEGERTALPYRWEVCDYCDGRGSSSAHLGAFTSDELWEHGEDFVDDYVAGLYDRDCPECGGRTTVPVVDEVRCNPAALAAYERQQQAQWESWAESEAERRAGC